MHDVEKIYNEIIMKLTKWPKCSHLRDDRLQNVNYDKSGYFYGGNLKRCIIITRQYIIHIILKLRLKV